MLLIQTGGSLADDMRVAAALEAIGAVIVDSDAREADAVADDAAAEIEAQVAASGAEGVLSRVYSLLREYLDGDGEFPVQRLVDMELEIEEARDALGRIG